MSKEIDLITLDARIAVALGWTELERDGIEDRYTAHNPFTQRWQTIPRFTKDLAKIVETLEDLCRISNWRIGFQLAGGKWNVEIYERNGAITSASAESQYQAILLALDTLLPQLGDA